MHLGWISYIAQGPGILFIPVMWDMSATAIMHAWIWCICCYEEDFFDVLDKIEDMKISALFAKSISQRKIHWL